MTCFDTGTATDVLVDLVRGDSLRLQVELDGTGGDIDVTDWSFLAQLRDTTDVLVTALAVEVVDPATGLLVLELTPAETAALPPGDYVFDLQATDVSADVRTLFDGRMRVRPDVSRV